MAIKTKHLNIKDKIRGFTLVELSIVIVIIGFLIAGIVSGTSLIKQAALRSVINDFYNYITAYNTFFDKYRKVPGDMDTADIIFGVTNCAASAAVCNGNGNGIIEYTTNNTNGIETNKAWKHLELSRVLGAGFVLIPNTGITTIGQNAPTSKVAGGGYVFMGGVDAAPFDADINAVWIGRQSTTGSLVNSSLSPEDAFSIDSKADDGAILTGGVFSGATTGGIRARDGADSSGNCVDTTTTPKGYKVSNKFIACILGQAVNL